MRILLILVALASTASAWDGPGMWYRRADADDPGGGGILGTGGGHDHGIKCTDCHVERATEPVTFALAFSPALPVVGSDSSFTPGQTYTVTARLTGASLTSAGCANDMDGFAASFEDDAGAATGMLASDSGQTATSCATLNADTDPGTTALNGDCKVIFARKKASDQWTFTWKAPTAGAIHIHWGAVDGNCDMMSMKDAVVTGSTTLRTPAAAPSIVRFALLPLIVLATL
ncbi:MAG: hypothetical protein ABI678_04125 [Kofleriaceae bacterium]